MNDESRLQTEADLQAAMSAYTPHELEELKQTAAHARNQRPSRQNQAETERPASDGQEGVGDDGQLGLPGGGLEYR